MSKGADNLDSTISATNVVEQLHLTKSEKFFLAGLAVGSLLISVGFAVGTTVWKYGFPATVVAFLLGLALATLSYAFLGGVRGNELTLGGIKLAGTAAVVGAILYFLPGPLRTDMNDAQLLEKGRAADAMIKAAEERGAASAHALRLVDSGQKREAKLSSGGSIALEDITSSHGDLKWLKSQAGAENVFAELLRRAKAFGPPAGLSSTQGQWDAWLAGLSLKQRQHVERIAFARLNLKASDDTPQSATVFKGQTLRILNRDGKAEASLCFRYILNIVENGSDEQEVLIFQERPCVEADAG
jgi:hypothetical protein